MLFRSSLRLRHWDPGSARLDLEVGCSAGTYIRSLARDLGERLGCGGALAQLRRTSALGFGLAGAVGLETLKEAGGPPALRNPLEALAHLPRRHLLDSELVGWRCGRSLPLPPGSVQPALTAAFAQNPDDHPGADVPPIAVIHPDGSLAGIGRCDPEGRLQPRLVLSAAG